jgi:hypothetical protein
LRFSLAVRAGVAGRAEAFQLIMRARVAVHAAASSAGHAGRGCSPRSCFSLCHAGRGCSPHTWFSPFRARTASDPIARVPLRARPTAPADMTRSRQVVAVRVVREKRFRR